MRKINLIAIILLLIIVLIPNYSTGEELFCPGRDCDMIIVFKTEDLLKFATKHLVEGGSNWDPVFIDTINVIVKDGTKCSVIERKSGIRKVRIMTGPWKGKVGWVHSEMVR